MKEIVILSRNPKGSAGLAVVLEMLFPECDIRVVPVDIKERDAYWDGSLLGCNTDEKER